jgi:ABC-type transport system involved in multi-copper enzyme maturation permease subunit
MSRPRYFDRTWVIARTAWQETLRKQVFYIALAIMALVFLIIASQMMVMHMAVAAGEYSTAMRIRTSFVQMTIGVWNCTSIFLAVFLGSCGYSTEVTRKTIIHILSRPVERSAYLLGRWLGILCFLWAFLAVGIGLSLALALSFDVPWTPAVSLTALSMVVETTLLSGLTLALSTVLVPVLAGCCGYALVVILPFIAQPQIQNPHWILRALAYGSYFISPAQMPPDVLSNAFAKSLAHPNYGLYLAVCGENVGYVLFAVVLGCWIFSRRELRLR